MKTRRCILIGLATVLIGGILLGRADAQGAAGGTCPRHAVDAAVVLACDGVDAPRADGIEIPPPQAAAHTQGRDRRAAR
jgi:hypothetical protein